jgi:plastocyanin
VNIEVEGFQWQWAFHYTDEGVTVQGGSVENPPEMVVPINRPFRLTLRSDDVIHSFFVPNFLTKRDLVPYAAGIDPNHLEFTVNRLGTFRGQCAEFCGDGHAQMTFIVTSMEQADYDAWVAEQQAKVTPTPPAGSEPAGLPVVKISADKIAFDTTELAIPAGQEFIIEFTNKEAVPHNVAIYDGDRTLFQGEWLTGPGTIRYDVPAIDAGEYTFQCDVHPSAMSGTVTAR